MPTLVAEILVFCSTYEIPYQQNYYALYFLHYEIKAVLLFCQCFCNTPTRYSENSYYHTMDLLRKLKKKKTATFIRGEFEYSPSL